MPGANLPKLTREITSAPRDASGISLLLPNDRLTFLILALFLGDSCGFLI